MNKTFLAPFFMRYYLLKKKALARFDSVFKIKSNMKYLNFLIAALVLFTIDSYAQKVEKITANGGVHYITTTIDYPITGTYLFSGEAEPIVQLNPDGTGIFQLHDLSKTNIDWGMECFENGTAKYQKGFNYAVYSLWYKNKGENEAQWTYAHFSIHFQKKKMFISGERSKDYTDPTTEIAN
jgi:hypothetical protein